MIDSLPGSRKLIRASEVPLFGSRQLDQVEMPLIPSYDSSGFGGYRESTIPEPSPPREPLSAFREDR